MLFNIKLADRIIEIKSLYSQVYTICKDYIVPIGEKIMPSATIEINNDDLTKESLIATQANEKLERGQYSFYNPGDLEVLAVQRKICEIMPVYSTFLMHGSAIATNGKAYLITAPSGIGKTTRTRLWMEAYPDSIVINGDKPLIRLVDDKVYVCGTPWCGKEGWNTNLIVPLDAILLLERANDDEMSTINELNLLDVFDEILKQVYIPENKKSLIRTLSLLKSLNGKLRFYRFRSAPTIESVCMAFEAVTEKK